ncbi:TetR/AcrR family transcriptional regulator C-terminal domain-containing protein [Streptomyces sp. NBC_01565]|uniref:TetR/AcrR family transcriptional regulator n=1 Tax=unclassified Streptomyces TaxID=2593676 RepID=UPI002258A662|nr:TetR/AcrR family transcriptional regulator C-terminal domain-containing protein [Streptomyces sp. NBC_01565]MCX4545856.1 TetR/AcrR family transcriptional regulator C-terminal domain-containing protein [Streptomyces sp. NBC_01565]
MTSEQWSAAVRLLWGPPAKPARGPKRGLTLDGIALAGVGIADAEGLGGVSMQRVAAELAVTKMALYRYVPGKAELVALMVEAALPDPAELDAGLAGGEWRERLRVWAHGLYEGFRAHPWLLEATVGARVMGPRELGWMERALAALEGCGLSGAEAMDSVVLVAGHVRGIAEQERAMAGGIGGEGPDAQLVVMLGEVLRVRGDDYPALAAALGSVAEQGGQDQALLFGLERILDGLELLVARRAAAGS